MPRLLSWMTFLLASVSLPFSSRIGGVQLVAGKSTPDGGEGLFTTSVTYCSEAKAVLVSEFDIAYWRANQSATFSISAASVESNLDISANIYANAYGLDVINITINLCSYLQGVLCPLPQINFTGYGTYPIAASYTKDIPSIAWTVPDLEAFARITLTNANTGEVAACLQATLSNGLSTKQPAVAWATGMFFLVYLLVALVFSTLKRASSPAMYRWFDVLFLFQAAAASGLVHVNYPSNYLNFTLNFAWALGLFRSDSIENAINRLRGRTGGKLSDQAFPAVDYINRKLSPYNDFLAMEDVVASESPVSYIKSYLAERPASNVTMRTLGLTSRAIIPTVSEQDTTSQLSTGVQVYLNSLGIATANGFDTIFLVYLIAIAVAIGAHLLFFGVVLLVDMLQRSDRKGTGWAGRLRTRYLTFCAGNALRLCLIFLFPVLIFGFYQFRIGRNDSWLSILLAVLCIIWTLVPLFVIFVLSIIRANRDHAEPLGANPLYTRYSWYNSAGFIYRAYRQKYHFWWFAPLILAMFTMACFIGFGQGNAWAQVIGLIVVEFIVFVSCIGFRPHKDKKGDWLGAFLSFCRLAAFGLLIAFIPSVGVKAITRTIIGFVIIVLFGIPTVLLFLGFFYNLGYGWLWRRNTGRMEDGLEVQTYPLTTSDDSSARQPAMVQIDGDVPPLGDKDLSKPSSQSSIVTPLDAYGVPMRNSKVPYANGGYNNGYAGGHNAFTDSGGYDIDGARAAWNPNAGSATYGYQYANPQVSNYQQRMDHTEI